MSHESTSREGSLAPRGRLTYVPEFRKLITETPGLLRAFISLENQIKRKIFSHFGDVFEANGIKITLLNDAGGTRAVPEWDVTNDRQPHPGSYLKVEIGKNKFFVKTIPGHKRGYGRGHDEVSSLEELRNAVRGIDKVEVVDFQLGYQDKERTYFVSKWIDAINLAEYLYNLKVEKEKGELDLDKDASTKKLEGRITVIKGCVKAAGFFDVFDWNMLYDKKTDVIYLFDMHK